jgi:hypothetical protein
MKTKEHDRGCHPALVGVFVDALNQETELEAQAILVKKLRAASGSGVLFCVKALQQAEWDYDKAWTILSNMQPPRLPGCIHCDSSSDDTDDVITP